MTANERINHYRDFILGALREDGHKLDNIDVGWRMEVDGINVPFEIKEKLRHHYGYRFEPLNQVMIIVGTFGEKKIFHEKKQKLDPQAVVDHIKKYVSGMKFSNENTARHNQQGKIAQEIIELLRKSNPGFSYAYQTYPDHATYSIRVDRLTKEQCKVLADFATGVINAEASHVGT